MLIRSIENFLFFSTLLSLGGFAVARTARELTARRIWQPHPFTLTRIYAAAVALPPIMAGWVVAAALLPQWWLDEAAFDNAHPAPLHKLHLLGYLTAPLEPTLGYATAIFLFAAALFAICSSVRAYSRISSVIERLEMNASPPPPERLALVEQYAARHGLAVGLIMSDYPFSFIWGYLNSKLVLSSGLLHAVTAEELAGLLEHEAAHNSRRDNLVKLALSVSSYTSMAFPLMRRVLKWRALEVEMVCDEVAAARTSAPLEVAEALMKMGRQTLAPIARATGGTVTSGFIPEDSSGFELRVTRLLNFTERMPNPARALVLSQTCKSEALLVAGLFAASLVALCVCAPLAVHRAAESIISIIV